MASFLDTCLKVGEIATIDGSVTYAEDGSSSLVVKLQKYNGIGWDVYANFPNGSYIATAGVEVNYSNYGTYEFTMTEGGVYRCLITSSIGTASNDNYVYFEVEVAAAIPQPTLQIVNVGDGLTVNVSIIGSDATATNKIYIKKYGTAFSDTPSLTLIGNTSSDLSLAVGHYYAIVVSITDFGSTGGKTDPLEFWVAITHTAGEQSSNISNIRVEEITNTIFGNQFITHFTKIPQIGYYQQAGTKYLNLRNLDKLNESIRGTTLPQSNTPMIPLAYFGHQNDYKMGVGDGNLGSMSVRLKLDRYLNNYSTFLNWHYMKYDWTYGGKNPAHGLTRQEDVEGRITIEFLDADENITRTLAYKVIIDVVPSLNLAVDTPDEIEFEISFVVTDIDPSQFITATPLSDLQKIL